MEENVLKVKLMITVSALITLMENYVKTKNVYINVLMDKENVINKLDIVIVNLDLKENIVKKK